MKEYTYEDLKLGMQESFTRVISSEDINQFSKITGDRNPLHLSKEYAESTEFKKPVVFGLLVNSFLSTLAGMFMPGKYSLIVSVDQNFKKPCFEGDELTVIGEVFNKIDSQKVIILKTLIKNQNSEVLQEGKMFVKVLK